MKCSLSLRLSIRTYPPREGTETRLSNQILRIVPYKNLSTSRGVGNIYIYKLNNKFEFGIDTYLPREGSETLFQSIE